MTIYYVYVNGTYRVESTVIIDRVLLTIDSRYVADELFRKLPTVETRKGVNYFRTLTRKSPQFWSFDTTDSPADPAKLIMDALYTHDSLSEFRLNVMPKILGSMYDRTVSWPIIPIVPGPDWLDNGVYFIRDKRRPDRYWNFVHPSVYVSDTKMSKFKISTVEFGEEEEESKVLIRSDLIRIRPLQAQDGCYLDVGQNGNNVLSVSLLAGEWTFGELLGGFKEGGEHGAIEVTWGDDGDHWELC